MTEKQKQYKETIHARGHTITLLSDGKEKDYLSLTDIAKYKSAEPNDVIKNWLRSRDTLDFLGLWETLNNPGFNIEAFETLRNESGRNAFTLSPTKWIETTNAAGILTRPGINGGTYAQKDIAFEFASWVSAEFKLYIIKDYQRLKTDENSKISLDWNLSRSIAKINYKIHTDAIKETLIPKQITRQQQTATYANEADVINIALFGKTAREWRDENPDLKGNIRDHAQLTELIILSNLETLNAEYIYEGLSQNERLVKLNQAAIRQAKSLLAAQNRLLPK
ncbi:MAG TPA: KilA-N domain-containing protein [Methanocorpusculum sp.]|nr:KilA-N domain-containing protein [Methanocorpusculum sp.]